MSLSHFVQWRRLHDDGGGFRACFFEACSSKIIARETVKKKRGVGGGATSRVDGERPRVWVGSDLAGGLGATSRGGLGELHFNAIGEVFFSQSHGRLSLSYKPRKNML